MARGHIEIRALGPADDLDELADLRTRAFGPATAAERARWQAQQAEVIAAGRYLAAFDGTRMIAGARFHDMTQWWLGRDLPMAGVASVKVAPEYRGAGAGSALMAALLDLIAARGYPLSVLYPATMPMYRSLGWELAGHNYGAMLPARSLRSVAPPAAATVTLRRATPGDAAAVRAVHAEVHAAARDCGPLVWDESTVRHWLADDSLFSYLTEDGFVAYRWGGHHEILVERAIAGSQATTRALCALLASSSSVARTLRVRVGPTEPFGLLMSERDVQVNSDDRWMLRVVDAPAAVAGRGYPAGLELAAPLRLADGSRAGHEGHWMLRVGSGKGTLDRYETAAAADPVVLDARGFAAMYAGTPAGALRRAGLASGGDPGHDALLDAAFAAQPFCLDSF